MKKEESQCDFRIRSTWNRKGTKHHRHVICHGRKRRELMGEKKDYYNMVFADKKLSIDRERLYTGISISLR